MADPVRNVAMKGDKASGEALIKALETVDALIDNDYFAGKCGTEILLSLPPRRSD